MAPTDPDPFKPTAWPERSDINLHERVATLEQKVKTLDERGTSALEKLEVKLGEAKGAARALVAVVGVVAGVIGAWIESWFHK